MTMPTRDRTGEPLPPPEPVDVAAERAYIARMLGLVCTVDGCGKRISRDADACPNGHARDDQPAGDDRP